MHAIIERSMENYVDTIVIRGTGGSRNHNRSIRTWHAADTGPTRADLDLDSRKLTGSCRAVQGLNLLRMCSCVPDEAILKGTRGFGGSNL